jgi:hypothetical protein
MGMPRLNNVAYISYFFSSQNFFIIHIVNLYIHTACAIGRIK